MSEYTARDFVRTDRRTVSSLARYAGATSAADLFAIRDTASAPLDRSGQDDAARLFKERLQAVLDALPDASAIMSSDGTIVQANESWLRNGRLSGGIGFEVGDNCFEGLLSLADDLEQEAHLISLELAELCRGERAQVSHAIGGMGFFSERKFKMVFSAFGTELNRRIMVCAQEVTELQRLKDQREQLVDQVLHAQEDERRRIARELHDSTSQLIVCLGFNLVQLERAAKLDAAAPLLGECFSVVEHLQQEVRALSYLYHPPRFDEDGFRNGLHRLITGAAKRSGFTVQTFLDEVQDASPVVVNTLYRVAQEALTNIHRHASATHVRVTLCGRRDYIHLRFEDNGVGVPSQDRSYTPQLGVGICGMRERLRELGGRLSMPRAKQGTVVLASVPRNAR